jgi:hypothetical protein
MTLHVLRAAVLVCSGAIVLGAVCTAQTPQRDPVRPPSSKANDNATPTGTATVGGTVVADATGSPVRLAYVALIGAETGVLKVTSTDSAGKFAFKELPADRYTVAVSKLPYLGTVAGARRPGRPGTPIAVANGAAVNNLSIRLPMSASISCVVLDERGQPANGAAVAIYQRRMQNGKHLLTLAGQPVSVDDRGMYRVHGLPPGEYIVSATQLRQDAARVLTTVEVDSVLNGGAAPPPLGADGLAYVPVYFPGTPRLNDARPVALVAGDDRQNIDFQVGRVKLGQVEGTIVVNELGTYQTVSVLIETVAGSSPMTQATGRTSRILGGDGTFSFDRPPGRYTVFAETSGAEKQVAFMEIDVESGQSTPVHMTLQPPISLAGHFVANGTASVPPLSGHRVVVTGLSSVATLTPQVSPTGAAGAFTVKNLVPGRYVIGSTPFFGASVASASWSVESVLMDGRDVTDLPVLITNDTVPKELSIVLGNRWQQLAGRLTDERSKGVSDYAVLLFPVNEEYWFYGTRRIVTTLPGTDGTFTLGGPGPSLLPPGEYYLAAVTDVTKDEQYDPAFLKSIAPAAIRVTIAPGARARQDLRIR